MSLNRTLQLSVMLAVGLGIGLGFSQLPEPQPAIAAPIQNRYNPHDSLAPLVEDLSPAVVNIDTETEVQGQLMPFFGMPYEIPDETKKQQGQGSGFIISEDGYILTNYHVIEGADRVKVRTKDGNSYEGTVVGTDDSTDIALIKIEAQNLPNVELGDSDSMRVGDWVVAIGNPFGLGHTVTAGIISAKENSMTWWTGPASPVVNLMLNPQGLLVQVLGPDQECWSEIQYQRAKSSS